MSTLDLVGQYDEGALTRAEYYDAREAAGDSWMPAPRLDSRSVVLSGGVDLAGRLPWQDTPDTFTDADGVIHGTYGAYSSGCRCPRCTREATSYQAGRRARGLR